MICMQATLKGPWVRQLPTTRGTSSIFMDLLAFPFVSLVMVPTIDLLKKFDDGQTNINLVCWKLTMEV
jgi:hypothetical protein